MNVVVKRFYKRKSDSRAHDMSRNLHHHRDDKLIALYRYTHILQQFGRKLVYPDIFEAFNF